MAKFFGLDRLFYMMKIIRGNGGIRASLYKIYIMDELKIGSLVGTDKYGNKYFENPRFFFSRNRWIEFAPKYGIEYDASQVPAEWYGWLHYKTDLPPMKDPSRPKHKWMADHTENETGFKGQFMPFSTTRPKVKAWIPCKTRR